MVTTNVSIDKSYKPEKIVSCYDIPSGQYFIGKFKESDEEGLYVKIFRISGYHIIMSVKNPNQTWDIYKALKIYDYKPVENMSISLEVKKD